MYHRNGLAGDAVEDGDYSDLMVSTLKLVDFQVVVILVSADRTQKGYIRLMVCNSGDVSYPVQEAMLIVRDIHLLYPFVPLCLQ